MESDWLTWGVWLIFLAVAFFGSLAVSALDKLYDKLSDVQSDVQKELSGIRLRMEARARAEAARIDLESEADTKVRPW